jgi:hypothetical protein
MGEFVGQNGIDLRGAKPRKRTCGHQDQGPKPADDRRHLNKDGLTKPNGTPNPDPLGKMPESQHEFLG